MKTIIIDQIIKEKLKTRPDYKLIQKLQQMIDKQANLAMED